MSKVTHFRQFEQTDSGDLCLVNTFLAKYRKSLEYSSCVRANVEIILSQKGNASIKNLSMLSKCCSQRQIERNFKSEIGTSPKKFSEVIQFKYALELLKQNKYTLVDIALSAGYYDQAHFINSFKKFTGTTPENFLKQSSKRV